MSGLTNSPFQLKNRSLLTEQVYISLKNAIFAGVFKPGERLREIELAEKLGVSRTPIREAISQLKLEGLLTPLAGGGVKVVEFSIDEIHEIFDLRVLLETYGIQKAIENISEAQLKRLDEIVATSKIAYQQGNLERIIELNTQFHNEIITASRNKRLGEFIASLRNYLQAFRNVSMRHSLEPEVSLSGHTELLQAIKERDQDKALETMHSHLAIARKLFLEMLRNS
ncbi:MAG: GntR family transcriptional regulator [Syntrophomonadaceae bacterium]|nr:GntR family transcriptional regulator [Syntrophomonadaceae bacterium]